MLAVLLLMAMLAAASPTTEAVPYQTEGIMASGVALKGVNWFGFNNGGTMLDGLWGGPGLMSDFATVVWRQKLLGFNAIRLPFSFQDLNKPPRSFRYDYCTPPRAQEVAASITPPGRSPPQDLPRLPAPPHSPTGKCNDYLPETSTFDRFVWVAKFYAANGFYVVVDNHLREDQTALNDRAGWPAAWARLARALAADPVLKSKLLIDVLNEPDNFGLRWEAAAGKPALKDLYLSAMDAIEGAVPGLTFLVEGTGNGGIFANWGDGFTTDGSVISEKGVSDARPFFHEILSKPYRLRVVLSPHIYPPSVTNTDTNSVGSGLFYRLSTSFGTKMTEGYCAAGDCQRFGVAVGEFGSRFSDSRDLRTLPDLADYFNNRGAAADSRHAPIDSWFYWSWNANSGDTGGLVADNWIDIQWEKVDYLTQVGLRPWYA